MIVSLEILNLLSHKKTKMEFSKGVNIIVGPTDSGKSAIIKGIRWLLFNRPLGDGLRSSWGGDTGVSVIVDGKSVDRVKNVKNSYFIDELRFDAVKGDIPIEIQKVLNLTEINLQTQFDSHFLLSNSSGEVAQYFNKIAHLDKIDTGLQNIQRWTRDIQWKLEHNEQELESAKAGLTSYSYLDKLEAKLARLEKKDKDMRVLMQDKESLEEACEAIKQVDKQLEEISFLQELEQSVNAVYELGKKWSELGLTMSALKAFITRIKKVDEELEDTNRKLTKYEKQFHEELGETGECPLCGSLISNE